MCSFAYECWNLKWRWAAVRRTGFSPLSERQAGPPEGGTTNGFAVLNLINFQEPRSSGCRVDRFTGDGGEKGRGNAVDNDFGDAAIATDFEHGRVRQELDSEFKPVTAHSSIDCCGSLLR
jgi:hypothetical protein